MYKKLILMLSVLLCFSLTSIFAIAPTNPLTYYPFDNDYLDYSGNSNHATGVGTSFNPMGKINEAVILDTLTDRVQLTNNNVLSSSANSITHSMWIKTDPQTQPLFVFAKAYTGAQNDFYQSALTNTGGVINGNVNFLIQTGSSVTAQKIKQTSGVNVSDGQYHHLVYIWDSSTQNMSIYIDGVLRTDSNWIQNGNIGGSMSQTEFNLGSRKTNTGAYNPSILADFDEFYTYQRALTPSEILDLYNLGGASLNIVLNNPAQNTNYTFDVPYTILNVTTNLDSVCSYYEDTIQTNFSSTGLLEHTYNYSLGVATNETQQFDLTLSCFSESGGNLTTNQSLTFYRQSVPLDLIIYVPQDQQTFDFDTEEIGYYIETNYVSTCEYTTLNETDNFTQTGNIEHRTNYSSFFPEIREYPTSFTCEGVFINESVTLNVTYFLDEIPNTQIANSTNALTLYTGQIPQVGSNVGGFLSGMSSGVVTFIFALIMVGVIVSIITLIIGLIKKSLNKTK